MNMSTLLVRSAFVLVVVACCRLAVQAAEPIATLKNGNGHVNFKYLVVFPGESKGEKRIIALATQQQLPAELIKKVRAQDADAQTHELGPTYLKAVYLESGELKCFHASGRASLLIARDGNEIQSEFKLNNGRAKGSIMYEGKKGREIKISMAFDVPFGAPDDYDEDREPESAVQPSMSAMSGKFLQDGKPLELAFVSAQHSEPIHEKEAVWLVFTVVDQQLKHGRKRPQPPWIDARNGAFGSAFVLQVNQYGIIWDCEVVASPFAKLVLRHAMHMVEFEIIDGHVQGLVTTGGEKETPFGKFDVELTFEAPLPPDPK